MNNSWNISNLFQIKMSLPSILKNLTNIVLFKTDGWIMKRIYAYRELNRRSNVFFQFYITQLFIISNGCKENVKISKLVVALRFFLHTNYLKFNFIFFGSSWILFLHLILFKAEMPLKILYWTDDSKFSIDKFNFIELSL